MARRVFDFSIERGGEGSRLEGETTLPPVDGPAGSTATERTPERLNVPGAARPTRTREPATEAQIAAQEAAVATAKAQLAQARVNLKRTQVRAPVNGTVTNLLLRVGDYATTGTVNLRLIDTDSFWIDGYFEETKMAAIRVGDPAEMALMGYGAPLRGTVESITLGIATANAAPSTQGLPNVDPVYTWVRLAQRVPVRIRIDQVPDGVPLVAGMTATVVVNRGAGARPGWFADLHRAIIGAP